jgi:dTMP kinase
MRPGETSGPKGVHMQKFKGFLITLEGRDGLGKSTQAQLLADALQDRGYPVVLTREPGGTPAGRELRKIILDPAYNLSKAALMLLYQADRAQHYKEVLKPNLKAGKIVISDRFLDSTLVYQGHGLGWSLPLLYRLHNATTGMLMPDLTFILDGTSFKALGTDTLEALGNDFQKDLREGYLNLAATSPRYKVIPANQPVEYVSDLILSLTLKYYAKKGRFST